MASSSSPCAACKLLRRKCTQGCVFAPYFPADQPRRFENVHRVFGASNVTKLLNELGPAQREDTVNSLSYEADMRLRDPVYGSVGYIFILQHKLRQVQYDLEAARKELAGYVGHNLFAPAPTPVAAPFYPQNYVAPQAAVGPVQSFAPTQMLLGNVPQQQLREQELMRSFEQDLLRYEAGSSGGGSGVELVSSVQNYGDHAFQVPHPHPQLPPPPVQIQYTDDRRPQHGGSGCESS